MAQILYTNNAVANTAADIGPSDLSLTLTSGAPFPSPTGGDYFFLTLDDGSNIEIIKVTARSGDVLTIERAQQGTTAGTFVSGTPVALRVTAGGFSHIYNEVNLKLDASAVSTFGGTLISVADAPAARTTLGLGNLATVTASAFALTILDDADASAVRTTIGAAATSHTHAAGDITSGTIATARLGSGTANSSAYLRGDSTWQTIPSGGDMLKSENLSGLANYTTARSNLGLGTASTQNTGTSGANIPFLDGTNTWSNTQDFTGGFTVGSGTEQTDGIVRMRKAGNNIEFGHTNTGGYHATLGAEVGTGNPFVALSAEAGTTNNTYRTRGRYGAGMRISGGDGELQFFALADNNADNQSHTTTFKIKRTGEAVLIDAGPTDVLAAGFRGAPRNQQDSNYTLVLSDAGKSIVGYGSTSSQTWTIPANSSVAYPIGTTITFVNMRSVTCSIAITTDTLYLAGSGSTGTRTLAAYSWCTAIKVDTNNWMIGGVGLT